MNRRQALWTGGVAVVAAGAGVGGALWQHRVTEVPPAGPSPTLWQQRFERPDGGELVMDSLRGRPLLLNFWATWCAPCVKEMPLIDAFYQQHRAHGWQVVGLAVDGPTPVREFLTRIPISFPIGLAGLNGVDLGRELGNQSGALPFSVVFDRRGQVAFQKLGVIEPADLTAWAGQLTE